MLFRDFRERNTTAKGLKALSARAPSWHFTTKYIPQRTPNPFGRNVNNYDVPAASPSCLMERLRRIEHIETTSSVRQLSCVYRSVFPTLIPTIPHRKYRMSYPQHQKNDGASSRNGNNFKSVSGILSPISRSLSEY